MIGAIVERTSRNQPRFQPIIRAQPVKYQKVAGKSRGFVAFRTPHKKNGTWMVTATTGFDQGKEWATPSCLVTSLQHR